jgi:hypothetical protein
MRRIIGASYGFSFIGALIVIFFPIVDIEPRGTMMRIRSFGSGRPDVTAR